MVDLTHMCNCVLDDPQTAFCDTSGPLFSLYSKMVEEDDNNMAERQQKDAEGIVLFVSPRSCSHTPKGTPTEKRTIDRLVLSRSRRIDYSVDPRPQARLTGY